MNKEWTPDFPVHVYYKDMKLPDNGNYFVIAGNGCWMHKDTGLCKCFIPVDRISFLDDLKADLKLEFNLPKIPLDLVWQIKQFFKIVFDNFSSESEVNLLFNKKENNFKIHVPEQTVSHTSVKYKRWSLNQSGDLKDYLFVGTFHSHSDFDSFHSHTDVQDETHLDGVHFTFGNNDKQEFSITASIVINGFRKEVDPLNFLQGIQKSDLEERYIFVNHKNEKQDELLREVNDWLKNVKPLNNKYLKKQYAHWKDGMFSSTLRNHFGDGPFEVLSKKEDKILLKLPDGGDFELSNKLFEIGSKDGK